MQILFNEQLVVDSCFLIELLFLCLFLLGFLLTAILCLPPESLRFELRQLLVSLLQGVLLETSLELRLCDLQLAVLSFGRSLLSVTPLFLFSLSFLFSDFLLSQSFSFFKRFSEFYLLLSLDSGNLSKASLFCSLCSLLLCGKPCHLRLLLESFSLSLLSQSLGLGLFSGSLCPSLPLSFLGLDSSLFSLFFNPGSLSSQSGCFFLSSDSSFFSCDTSRLFFCSYPCQLRSSAGLFFLLSF